MADKIWTATDIELGKLTILPLVDGEITIQRRYVFLGAGGEVLTDIASGRLNETVVFSSLPQSIRDALATIDDWTYNRSLDQEGML